MMKKKRAVVSVLLCIAAIFAISCSSHLLKTHQDGASVLVRLENGGARNATSKDYKIKAWIENRGGSQSHHQEISSTAGAEVALTFDNLVIGSEITIHLEVAETGSGTKKFAGVSGWTTIAAGVNVIEIPLVEDTSTPGDDADAPSITRQPVSHIKTFSTGAAAKVSFELKVEAASTDNGTLSYQWYENTVNSVETGTKIDGATSATYAGEVPAKQTKYFYCVVTNTNNSVNGKQTAAVTTGIATVASVEGELTSIAAKYTGSQGYMLVGQLDYSDFTVTETYTSGTEKVSVEVTPDKSSYTIAATNNDSGEAIGHVPYTVTHTVSQKTNKLAVLTKYELSSSYLKIEGSTSIEQGKELKLTGQYKGDDGNDVQYKLYDESGSSNTYKVLEKANISWTGAAQQPNKWEALAETNTAGSKTATVKLSTGDEWCVTTSPIPKEHPYEVTVAASGSSKIVDETSLIEAINQSQDGEVITITQEITVTNTIAINKNIVIEGKNSGKLLRSNKDTITGPMFDISSSGNLTLQNITLDGQYNDNFYGGENNPFVINQGGTLIVSSSTLTNNRMSPTGTYGGNQLYASAAIYSAGTTTIENSTISEVSSNTNTRGIVYGVSGSLTISGTNITLPSTYAGNALYLEATVSYTINTKTSGLSQSYKSITPDSP